MRWGFGGRVDALWVSLSLPTTGKPNIMGNVAKGKRGKLQIRMFAQITPNNSNVSLSLSVCVCVCVSKLLYFWWVFLLD